MNKPEYNLTIARLYKTKKGYWTLEINSEEYDALQKVELGGRLVVKELTPEQRKSAKSPHAYLEYISKEKAKAFKAANSAKLSSSKPTDEDI